MQVVYSNTSSGSRLTQIVDTVVEEEAEVRVEQPEPAVLRHQPGMRMSDALPEAGMFGRAAGLAASARNILVQTVWRSNRIANQLTLQRLAAEVESGQDTPFEQSQHPSTAVGSEREKLSIHIPGSDQASQTGSTTASARERQAQNGQQGRQSGVATVPAADVTEDMAMHTSSAQLDAESGSQQLPGVPRRPRLSLGNMLGRRPRSASSPHALAPVDAAADVAAAAETAAAPAPGNVAMVEMTTSARISQQPHVDATESLTVSSEPSSAVEALRDGTPTSTVSSMDAVPPHMQPSKPTATNRHRPMQKVPKRLPPVLARAPMAAYAKQSPAGAKARPPGFLRRLTFGKGLHETDSLPQVQQAEVADAGTDGLA